MFEAYLESEPSFPPNRIPCRWALPGLRYRVYRDADLILLSTYPLVRKIAAEFHVGTVSISKAPNDE